MVISRECALEGILTAVVRALFTYAVKNLGKREMRDALIYADAIASAIGEE
jgi:hypothetical protein